jgi:hypothetical protein
MAGYYQLQEYNNLIYLSTLFLYLFLVNNQYIMNMKEEL